MKTVLTIIAAGVLITLASCHWVGKKGSGHITTQERNVQPFTKLYIDGVFPVELSQNGGDAWVKVETDDNLQNTVELKSEGDRLYIKSVNAHNLRMTKMKVYVNVKQLKELKYNSVGALKTVDVLNVDSLQVFNNAVGAVDLKVSGQYMRVNLNSVGSTILSGTVNELRINNDGVDALSAEDLKAKVTLIHNTSVGVTRIYADSAFYIRSSSVGALYYKGPGVVKELSSDGIGRVQKED
jgi:hypothetical protein